MATANPSTPSSSRSPPDDGREVMAFAPVGTPDTRNVDDESHARRTLSALADFRREDFLTDVTILVDNRRFRVHRAVIAAAIPYFRSMFAAQMLESTASEITINDIDPDAFELLVDYAYTSRINVTATNVQQILYAASILQMDAVCSSCQQFLTNYLTIANCLSMRAFAQQHNFVDLMHAVDAFSCDHFQQLRTTPDFMQISAEHLLDLVDNSDLNVRSEVDVYETVMAWIEENVEERSVLLPTLLSKVRLAQLSTDYLLSHVRAHPLIQTHDACRSLVFDAMEETLMIARGYRDQSTTKVLKRNETSMSVNASPTRRSHELTSIDVDVKIDTRPKRWSRPRKSAAGVIFCVGGRGTNGDPFRSVVAFDLRRNRWFSVSDMCVRRRHVGVVAAHEKLFAIGGHDGEQHLESAECFDPKTNAWAPVASMSIRRRGIAVGALEGAVYAVGGLDDSTCFQTVERYDVELNYWSTVASMNVQRGGVGVAALNKYLYAVGGNDGTRSLDSTERFDPHLDKWTLVAPMHYRRAGAGVAVLDGCMYAIGGFDDNAPLSSCERYDPRTDTWHTLPSMSRPRGGVGVAALGGRIYAVGGHDGRAYLDSVEAYDPFSNTWQSVTSISTCRAGAGVAWCNCSVDMLLRPPSYTSALAPANSGGGVAYCV